MPCKLRRLKQLDYSMLENLTPQFPWSMVAMDLFGPLPTSPCGSKYIFTTIDLFSGYPESYPIPDKEAETVARIFVTKVIPRHGMVDQILTDQGLEFNNDLNNRLCTLLGIKKVMTSSYHPQCNGFIERFHASLKNFLAKFSYLQQELWSEALPNFLLAFRNIPSTTTGFSPHFLNSGKEMRLPLDTILTPPPIFYGEDYVHSFLKELHFAFAAVRQNTQEIRAKVRDRHNQKIKDKKFDPGDLVYFFKNSQPADFSLKLNNKWQTYYRILRKIGPASYEIICEFSGKIVRTHEDKLVLANLESWDDIRPRPRPILQREEQTNPARRILPHRRARDPSGNKVSTTYE